jgi:hypothetical protein
MRSSSTVPHITALLRTRRASLRFSYLVLVTPFNSHDVIQTAASFDDLRRSAPWQYPSAADDSFIGKAHRLEA